jgi:hypothetical protein
MFSAIKDFHEDLQTDTHLSSVHEIRNYDSSSVVSFSPTRLKALALVRHRSHFNFLSSVHEIRSHKLIVGGLLHLGRYLRCVSCTPPFKVRIYSQDEHTEGQVLNAANCCRSRCSPSKQLCRRTMSTSFSNQGPVRCLKMSAVLDGILPGDPLASGSMLEPPGLPRSCPSQCPTPF